MLQKLYLVLYAIFQSLLCFSTIHFFEFNREFVVLTVKLRFYLFYFSGACVILAELAMEAGLPNGVLNMIHGTNVSSSIVD